MALEELKKDAMMVHLLDALDHKKDIGHYGRLVFTLVARHFLTEEEVIAELAKDKDFGETEAQSLYTQVKDHGYNPPSRHKILEYQAQQDFPIIPNPDDPDAGNVYRDLNFPDDVYKHIEDYRHQKESA